MNDEMFFGLGRTFILALAVMVAATIAHALGWIEADKWSMMLTATMAAYAAKSGLKNLGGGKKPPADNQPTDTTNNT